MYVISKSIWNREREKKTKKIYTLKIEIYLSIANYAKDPNEKST